MNLRRPLAAALLTTLALPARSQEPAPEAPPPAAAQPSAPPTAAAAPKEVEVILRSGPSFRGVVVGEDGRNVLLRSTGGAVRAIPRASIAAIVDLEQAERDRAAAERLAAEKAAAERDRAAAERAAAEKAALERARPDDKEVEVILRSGPSFRGVIVGEDERNVLLRSTGGAVRAIPRASIAASVAPEQAARMRSAAEHAERDRPAAERGAAERAGPDDVVVGLGVDLRQITLGFGGTTFYVPIQVGERGRVELELGFAKNLDDGGGSFSQAGVGVFDTSPVAPQVRSYYGARASWLRVVSDEGDDDDGIRLAAAAGAEWLPVRRVALGVEAQLVLALSDGDQAAGTAGQAFLRVFLW